MQYRQRAWAEISLDALTHNVETIRLQLSDSTEYCAVVKADAYGHGEEIICRRLYELGIRFYAVSSFEEAVRVRKWCPEGEILILGYTAPECAPMLAENCIIQTIVSVKYARALSAFAQPGCPVRCHIALDTGMGRIGVQTSELAACYWELETIMSQPGLQIEGLFTHFAVADEDAPDHVAYTDKQEEMLFHVARKLRAKGADLRHVHCMNSAAILYRNNPASTLARAGIIMYGLKPNAALEVPIALEPVLSFRSRISHIKTVEAGDCISYGRTYCADTTRRIATVTIGYADGYSRALSNKGEVLIGGVRCPITGRVCMDQMMVDVTDAPEAEIGSVVTLIGKDGSECITADDVAGLCGTIGYEIVCGISKRVPRMFLENGRLVHEDRLF
ncbi:MAG: alanine racemase [Oscillospiraceae bacterium]|nr:alanine racemase [Oscillospiraceae bacterium]